MHDGERHAGELRGQTKVGTGATVEGNVQDGGAHGPQLLGEHRDRREIERAPQPAECTYLQAASPRRLDQGTVAACAEHHRTVTPAAQGTAGGESQALRATLAEIEKSEDHRAGGSGRPLPELRREWRLRLARTAAADPAYGIVADHSVVSPDSKPFANSAPTSTRKDKVSKLSLIHI